MAHGVNTPILTYGGIISVTKLTRSWAIAEGPRDEPCHLNLVNCCMHNCTKNRIGKACDGWMTLKITHGHRKWLDSTGLSRCLWLVCSISVSVLHRFQYITRTSFSVLDYFVNVHKSSKPRCFCNVDLTNVISQRVSNSFQFQVTWMLFTDVKNKTSSLF